MIAARGGRRESILILSWLAVSVASGASSAWAQSSSPRWEMAAAALWTGRTMSESASADLIQADGNRLPLFRTAGELAAGPGLEVRLGGRLARRLVLEAAGAWSRSEARVRVSDDLDGAPAVSLAESVSRVSVEAAAVWDLAARGRSTIFIRAGGGWMREFARAGQLVEDGLVGNVGAGVKYWWRPPTPGQGPSLGFLGEARALVRSGGVSLGASGLRAAPVVSGGLLLGF